MASRLINVLGGAFASAVVLASLYLVQTPPAAGPAGEDCSRGPRCVPRGGVPVYYLNLERAVVRRALFEARHGACGGLRRVASVEESSPIEVIAAIDDQLVEAARQHGGSDADTLNNLAIAANSSPAALAFALSYWNMVRLAYEEGAAVAVFLEDDAMALATAVAKGETLAAVARQIDAERPDWRVLRLQDTPNSEEAEIAVQRSLFERSASRFASAAHDVSGTAAMMMNRSGMEQFLDNASGWSGQKRKFSCNAHRAATAGPARCTADDMIGEMPGVYRPRASLYSYMLTEKPDGREQAAELSRHEASLAAALRQAMTDDELQLISELEGVAAAESLSSSISRQWKLGR